MVKVIETIHGGKIHVERIKGKFRIVSMNGTEIGWFKNYQMATWFIRKFLQNNLEDEVS